MPEVIVIGTSAGGVAALREFFKALPPAYKTPIVVVQHLPRGPRLDLEMIYGRREGARFSEAEDKMVLRPGDIVMAAPDYHLAFEKDGHLSLSQDAPVYFSRPSIDILFESAARAFGSRVAAILMSGANQDGANGLLCVHRAGGLTIVQDPHEAQNPAMPKSALALFQPDLIAGVAEIAAFLANGARTELRESAAELSVGARS